MARIRPQTGFETILSAGISASANTIGVTTAPTETTGYMVIEPGTSNKEIIKYTGVSGTTLTGVSRGLALTGSDDSAGTGKAHAAGSTVSMTNVHYYMEQLAHEAEANTWADVQTFEATPVFQSAEIKIGDGTTDEDEKITANNGDAAKPYIKYNSATNKWLISNDGSNSYDPEAGGSGVTAGTDITIVGGAVSLDPTISQTVTFAEQVTIPATPVAATDAASKGYVDTVHTQLIASNNLKASSDAEVSTTDNVVAERKSPIYIYKSGIVRVKMDIYASGSASFQIYKNGVAFGTERSCTTDYTTHSEDLYVNDGDNLSIWQTTTFSGTKKVKNFRIYFDTQAVTYTIA